MIGPILFAGAVALAGGQSSFDAGVQATRAGLHEEAVEHFIDAIEDGARDPSVYHGLGNALYREGHSGLAVAAWRRGLVLAPRNGDIAANLDRARKESEDRLDPPERHAEAFFWQAWLAPRDGALAASVLLALALGSLLVRRIIRGRGRRVASWGWEAPLLAAGGGVLIASTVSASATPPSAVVVVPELRARSTLGEDGVELFVLHEGAEVATVERDGAHVLIALPDERKGWVSASAVVSAGPSDPFPRP